jgi:hypothetical protein
MPARQRLLKPAGRRESLYHCRRRSRQGSAPRSGSKNPSKDTGALIDAGRLCIRLNSANRQEVLRSRGGDGAPQVVVVSKATGPCQSAQSYPAGVMVQPFREIRAPWNGDQGECPLLVFRREGEREARRGVRRAKEFVGLGAQPRGLADEPPPKVGSVDARGENEKELRNSVHIAKNTGPVFLTKAALKKAHAYSFRRNAPRCSHRKERFVAGL